MAKYRVGIIGSTGKGDYGHGIDLPWKSISDCEVVAVADENEAGRRVAQTRTGASTSYADYREMLARERLNIVAICPRWVDRHHEMCLAAAESGCHIYMEKPFCCTLQQADEIVRACEMRHLKLAIAHVSRYCPAIQAARRLLREGRIGQLLELRARGKEDPKRGGGEDLWVLGTHLLDLMRYFAGDPVSCFARVQQDGRVIERGDIHQGNEGIGPLAGDHVEAVFRFQNGVSGSFSSRRGTGSQRFSLRILGTTGTLEMTTGYSGNAWMLSDGAWSPARSGRNWQVVGTDDRTTPDKSPVDQNRVAVLDLLQAIETGRQPLSGVYDALQAVEMVSAVFWSQKNRTPVSLPLASRISALSDF